jgi:serine/threonine-protein kinase RsbW
MPPTPTRRTSASATARSSAPCSVGSSAWAARAQCPIDRLDDAILLSDAVAAHAPTHAHNGHVQVVVAANDERLELRVVSLQPDGASLLLADGELPGVGNVFDRIADEVLATSSPDGESGELILRLNFRA